MVSSAREFAEKVHMAIRVCDVDTLANLIAARDAELVREAVEPLEREVHRLKLNLFEPTIQRRIDRAMREANKEEFTRGRGWEIAEWHKHLSEHNPPIPGLCSWCHGEEKRLREAKEEMRGIACNAICMNCAEGIPHQNEHHHKGGGYCYAWAIHRLPLDPPAGDAVYDTSNELCPICGLWMNSHISPCEAGEKSKGVSK